MRKLWDLCWQRLVAAVYFSRITLVGGEHLPRRGPVLYLGLHRNGAVDGFVYRRVLREPVFLISSQLRRSWFARLFFAGIPISRPKDHGDADENQAALQKCLAHLRAGGELFIFPEGTSTLGPQHLPFKSGAIWILLDYLQSGGPPLQVVPLGIHYERPEAFRSRVEVVAGAPIPTDLPSGASQLERVKIMKRRVQTALEEVGINVESSEQQERIERLAYVSTLGTNRSYFRSLKALERGIPSQLAGPAGVLEAQAPEKLFLHQGAPLFPIGPVAGYLAAFVLTCPIVAAAIALNVPPFLAGWLAGRKFADARNVVALWRILVGLPLFLLWAASVAVVTAVLGEWLWLAGYLAVTLLGLQLYYRVKKLGAAVGNALRQPRLGPSLLGFHQLLNGILPDEGR